MAKKTVSTHEITFPHPFVQAARRNRAAIAQQNQGVPFELSAVPDAELIANLVRYGQPRHAAQDVVNDVSGQCRLMALRFLFDCEDAATNPEARQRVDALRYMWSQLRREELIADDPRRVHGEIIDPRILL